MKNGIEFKKNKRHAWAHCRLKNTSLHLPVAQLNRATVFASMGELATRYGLAIEIISSNLIGSTINRRSQV